MRDGCLVLGLSCRTGQWVRGVRLLGLAVGLAVVVREVAQEAAQEVEEMAGKAVGVGGVGAEAVVMEEEGEGIKELVEVGAGVEAEEAATVGLVVEGEEEGEGKGGEGGEEEPAESTIPNPTVAAIFGKAGLATPPRPCYQYSHHHPHGLRILRQAVEGQRAEET